MKRVLLTGAAICAFTFGAFAQGLINVGNNTEGQYVSLTTAGNYYTGNYSLEVWMLNGAAVPADLTGVNGSVAGGAPADAVLLADTFKLETTFTGAMSGGLFSQGSLNMVDTVPHGANVVLALAIWNTSSAWVDGVPRGVAVFANPVGDPAPLVGPPGLPAELTGWTALTSDLVMTAIPEPSTFALAGLGAAALLIFRRRK